MIAGNVYIIRMTHIRQSGTKAKHGDRMLQGRSIFMNRYEMFQRGRISTIHINITFFTSKSDFSSSLPLYCIYMNARNSYNRIGRRVILHFWIDENLRTNVAAKFTLTLKFKVKSFSLHRILLIMRIIIWSIEL